MSSVFASLPVNPFEADVIREPREVTFSVQGLNDGALNHLIAEFEQLTVGELPRSPIPPPKAQLVVSPEAGYGKSHLLGRLFQAVGPRATQIYLLPFQAPERAWQSICWLQFKNWIVQVSTSCVRKHSLTHSQWESWLILQQTSWSTEE